MAILGVAVFAALQVPCFSADVCDCPLNDLCPGVREVDHLVSYPIIIGDYGYPEDILIYGASDLSRIEMTVPVPNEYYTIAAAPEAGYIFESTREDDSIICSVQSKAQVFEEEVISLKARFSPPSLKYRELVVSKGVLEDCGGYAFVPITPSVLTAYDGDGSEVAIKGRPGSLFYLWTEYLESFLWGHVYYRDGTTPFAGAQIHICAINGARFRSESLSLSDGYYELWDLTGVHFEWPHPEGIEAATGCYRLTVRVCLSQCSDCFEPEEIVLNRKEGGGIELGYHDFILPIDPPSPTPTPTRPKRHSDPQRDAQTGGHQRDGRWTTWDVFFFF
jgi:hypothetical protein